MKNKYFKIVLSILFLLYYQAFTQVPQFKNIRVLKGKSNYSVQKIYQDNSGFIWFGTSEGLVRFDGVNYTIYTPNDSLADNNITALCSDSLKQLWVGHKNGKISILKKGQGFIRFNPEEGIGDKEISSMVRDKEGKIWYSTLGEGVYYYHNNRLYNINTDDGLSDNFCYCMVIDNNQNIWIGTDAGISIYNSNEKKITSLSMKDGLPDNIVRSLVLSSDGIVWIGTEESGICKYNTINKTFTTVPNWKFGQVSDLAFSNKQNLWASAPVTGLINLIIDSISTKYRIFTTSEGLTDNKVQTVFCDRERNIWAGSQNGATLYTGELFTFLKEKQNPDFKNVYSQLIDQKNILWFCTADGLFKAQKDEFGNLKVQKLFKNNKAGEYKFISIFEATDGFIWAGTYGKGVLRINPENSEYKEFNTRNGLTDDNVINITGNKDFLIFTTLGKGISIYQNDKKGNFINFSIDNGLKSNYIYSAFIDKQNQIWLAQDGGGVSVIKENKIIPFEKIKQLGNIIYGFAQDSKQNIWMLAANEGLFKFDGNNITKFNTSNGLSSENNQAIIADQNDNLLIISNEGIDMLNTNTNAVYTYAEENGVAYLEPNLNAVFKDKNGKIWIGTNKGIIEYNPTYFKEEREEPRVDIARKQMFFKDIPENKVNFSHNENYFVFDYIGFWYKAPEKLIYRYKLDGYDINWRLETKSLTAVYSNLPDGNYTFRIEVSHTPGQWISSPNAVFSFKIRPPFWRTWWFIIFCIILGASSVYAFISLRLAKLRRDKEILELEVEKRTNVIKKQMEEIEAQRDQIFDKNKSITDSINYARRIQEAVLPPDELVKSFLPESFILYKPKDIVSGDFYWISKKDNKIIIAVADCTGHGVPGAFMSMLGATLLGEIVNKYTVNTASEILNLLRENIKNSLRQTGQQDKAKDGMDISLCVVEENFESLQFAGAYNPLYIIRNGELNEIKADRMPIGIYVNDKQSFTNNVLKLLKNDLLYLFSDGYADQTGGEKNRKFLHGNFKKLLVDIHQLSNDKQRQSLDDTIEKFRGDQEQVDDILVMGFRV